jgi:hypothetical protein
MRFENLVVILGVCHGIASATLEDRVPPIPMWQLSSWGAPDCPNNNPNPETGSGEKDGNFIDTNARSVEFFDDGGRFGLLLYSQVNQGGDETEYNGGCQNGNWASYSVTE